LLTAGVNRFWIGLHGKILQTLEAIYEGERQLGRPSRRWGTNTKRSIGPLKTKCVL